MGLFTGGTSLLLQQCNFPLSDSGTKTHHNLSFTTSATTQKVLDGSHVTLLENK